MKIISSLLLSFLLFIPSLKASSCQEINLSPTEHVISGYSKGNKAVIAQAQKFFTHLLQSYQNGEGLIDKDICRILDGVQFAAFKHRHQTRKNVEETPYIIHPIGVADQLLTIGKVRDPDILIAALLHDTVEDTDTTFDEICNQFGPRVEEFVREVTDDKSLPAKERKRLQILHAPDKSAGAAQIKLADKWYNLNDMIHSPPVNWTKERTDRYFDWAEKVVHGLPWVNAALLNAVDQILAEYRGS